MTTLKPDVQTAIKNDRNVALEMYEVKYWALYRVVLSFLKLKILMAKM
jgi:hypothetical protein